MLDSPMSVALWQALASHIRAIYGKRARVMRRKHYIYAEDPDGNWHVTLIVADDHLELSAWPADERLTPTAHDPLMLDRLDAALTRATLPLALTLAPTPGPDRLGQSLSALPVAA